MGGGPRVSLRPTLQAKAQGWAMMRCICVCDCQGPHTTHTALWVLLDFVSRFVQWAWLLWGFVALRRAAGCRAKANLKYITVSAIIIPLFPDS